MKILLKTIVLAIVTLFSMHSCIDSSYDFDNLNKDAEFKVPPIPLGSFDKIKLIDLRPVGAVHSIVEDTIKNILSGGTVDKFFYDGADNVSIEGKVDVVLKQVTDGKIKISFSIINQDGTLNTKVRIPSQELTRNGTDQDFKILFPAEDMIHMANARDLRLVIEIIASSVSFTSDDYIGIKDMVIKTGGINFEI